MNETTHTNPEKAMTLSNDTKQYLADVAEWASQHYGKDIIEYLGDADFMAQVMKEYNEAYRGFTAKAMTNSNVMSAIAEHTYSKI